MSRYEEIAAIIRVKIEKGDYPLNSKLPSISDLMGEHDTSLQTIRNAQGVLIDEGYLQSEQGVGVWVVSDNPTRELLDIPAAVTNAIDTLTTVLDALTKQAQKHTVRFDLDSGDTRYVLTEALRAFAARERYQAERDDSGKSELAEQAEQIIRDIENT